NPLRVGALGSGGGESSPSPPPPQAAARVRSTATHHLRQRIEPPKGYVSLRDRVLQPEEILSHIHGRPGTQVPLPQSSLCRRLPPMIVGFACLLYQCRLSGLSGLPLKLGR